MKYGSPATLTDYDQRSSVSASESYVGDVLYSRDIMVRRPKMGIYHLLLVAEQDFDELLVTAIMDTPPDQGQEANFVIRRMGRPA